MTEQEFLESMTYLGLAFNKTYTQEEIKQHYDFLKEYNDTTFTTAIKNLIRTSKFLPKITDLIEACESAKTVVRNDVLEYMKQIEYFKDPNEYQKASLFMERGIVPNWLQEDINKYYKQMVSNRLDHKETLMIGGTV